MILRDGCSTLYDLASLFRGRRNTLDRWSGKIGKGTTTTAPPNTTITTTTNNNNNITLHDNYNYKYTTLHHANYTAVHCNHKYKYNYTTQDYTGLITLHYNYNCNYNYHCITLHCTPLQLQLQYFTRHITRLHYTIPHCSTQHYSTLHCATPITP